MPAATGECRDSFKRYFYNQQQGRCEEFIYGGCEGNKNNFKTRDECEKSCGGGVKGKNARVNWRDFESINASNRSIVKTKC